MSNKPSSVQRSGANASTEQPLQQQEAGTSRSGLPATASKTSLLEQQKITEHMYNEYLKVDKLLGLHKDMPTHDERQFTVLHQTNELWFDQVLCEIDSVHELFRSLKWDANADALRTISKCLQRCVFILKLLVQLSDMPEAIYPQDMPSVSHKYFQKIGFESSKFRQLAEKIGGLVAIDSEHSEQTPEDPIYMTPEEAMKMKQHEIATASLSKLVQMWLKSMPGYDNLWDVFTQCFKKCLPDEEVRLAQMATDPQFEQQMNQYKMIKDKFYEIIDKKHFCESGWHTFPYVAYQGALLTSWHHDEPRFHVPNQLLIHLVDIDEMLDKLHKSHMAMVGRVFGRTQDTSVGYQKVFADLNDLRMWSEFRTRLTLQAPPLPPRRGPQSESQKEQQVNKSDTFSRRSPSKYTNGKGAQPETHITVPLPKKVLKEMKEADPFDAVAVAAAAGRQSSGVYSSVVMLPQQQWSGASQSVSSASDSNSGQPQPTNQCANRGALETPDDIGRDSYAEADGAYYTACDAAIAAQNAKEKEKAGKVARSPPSKK